MFSPWFRPSSFMFNYLWRFSPTKQDNDGVNVSGRFLCKSPNDAWEFLKDLDEKIMQRETIKDDNLNCRHSGAIDGAYVVFDLSLSILICCPWKHNVGVSSSLIPAFLASKGVLLMSCIGSYSEHMPLLHLLIGLRLRTGEYSIQETKEWPLCSHFKRRWCNHSNCSLSSRPNVVLPNQYGGFPRNTSQTMMRAGY